MEPEPPGAGADPIWSEPEPAPGPRTSGRSSLQQHPAAPVTAAAPVTDTISAQQLQQQQALSACNNCLQQQPAAIATAPVAAPVIQNNSKPVISPRMTSSRKKRKAASPVSTADCSEIEQVDWPAPSPRSSSEKRLPPSAPSSPGCGRTPDLAPLACVPPPAPPWSRFLPSHAGTVICGKCLAGCHGLGFQMCHECFIKANGSYHSILAQAIWLHAEKRGHVLWDLRKRCPEH